jgi:hypothetical protein
MPAGGTIPTGSPDIGTMTTYPWEKVITPSSAPHVWRLAEEIVKAKKDGPYSFRLGYVSAITNTGFGTPHTLTVKTDGTTLGSVSGVRMLSTFSSFINDTVLLLVMPGGNMIALGSLNHYRSKLDPASTLFTSGGGSASRGSDGVNTAMWAMIGPNTVDVKLRWTFGTSGSGAAGGTPGGDYQLTPPYPCTPMNLSGIGHSPVVGGGYFYDSSTNTVYTVTVRSINTYLQFLLQSGFPYYWSTTFPVAISFSDELQVSCTLMTDS